MAFLWNIAAMDMALSRTRVFHLLAAEALLLALAAAAATYRFGNIVGWLFEQSLTLTMIAALVIWFLVAWVARRTLAGSLRGEKFKGRGIVVFVLFRFGLIYGSAFLLVAWLVAAIAKLVVATVLIRAAILLMMAAMFTGIAGGAAVNSVVAVQRWRGRVAE